MLDINENENKIRNLVGYIRDNNISTVRILSLDFSMKFYTPKIYVTDKFHVMFSDCNDDEIYITVSHSQIYSVTVSKESELIIELR